METDDKPFSCSFSGCKQKFVTEDKLALHMQKHEFSFEGLPSSFFPDQTPTPTTFLRDCENIALFQDLGVKNPFDESFRKAVINPDEAELVDADGLDTPSLLPDSALVLGLMNTPTATIREKPAFLKLRSTLVTPTSDKATPPSFIADNIDTPTLDIISSVSLFPSISSRGASLRRSVSNTKSKFMDSPTCPVTSNILVSSSSPNKSTESDQQASSKPSTTSTVAEVNSTSSNNKINTFSTTNRTQPKRVQTPVSSSTKSDGAPPIRDSINPPISSQCIVVHPSTLPHGVVISQPAALSQPIALSQSAAVSFLVPAKPSSSLLTNTSSTIQQPKTTAHLLAHVITAQPITEASPAERDDTPASSLVKQRLKQTLKKEGITPNTISPSQVLDSQESGYSILTPSDISYTTGEAQKRALSPSEDDSQDDKRQKTLERNRDAARRCRKKKKIFVQGLEERLKQANLLNSHLLTENTRLKLEITELKSLFLDHKNCDVTRKQKASGSLNSLMERSEGLSSSVPSADDEAEGETMREYIYERRNKAAPIIQID